MASRHSRPPRECIQVMLWSVSILSATNTYVSRPAFPTSVVFLNRHIFIEASLLQPLHSVFFPPFNKIFAVTGSLKSPEIQFPFPPNPGNRRTFQTGQDGGSWLSRVSVLRQGWGQHTAFVCLQPSAGITTAARSLRVVLCCTYFTN